MKLIIWMAARTNKKLQFQLILMPLEDFTVQCYCPMAMSSACLYLSRKVSSRRYVMGYPTNPSCKRYHLLIFSTCDLLLYHYWSSLFISPCNPLDTCYLMEKSHISAWKLTSFSTLWNLEQILAIKIYHRWITMWITIMTSMLYKYLHPSKL